MGARTDIKGLDATIRDGGLCNNFDFSDEFVRELYKTNIKSGVDYMEFGYKASRTLFNEADFGKWKFCKEEDIRAIVGENVSDMKISVMADVGRCDFRTDFLPKSESVIDMVRVATYLNEIPAAVRMGEYCAAKGYETCVNVMAVSKAREEEISSALEILGESPVNVIYIVDSYGSLYPEQIAKLTLSYLEAGEKYKKIIGMHAHNNQQLAFANTVEAVGDGVDWLDGTYSEMGRGAGNCAMELLLGFLKNPKYQVAPILKIIEEYTHKFKAEGVKWGYDIPYLLTGQYNTHPRPAIQFVKEDRQDYYKFSNELYDIINS